MNRYEKINYDQLEEYSIYGGSDSKMVERAASDAVTLIVSALSLLISYTLSRKQKSEEPEPLMA